MTTKRQKKSKAVSFLGERLGGPLTFGSMLQSIRECEEMSQAEFARQLGMSRAHLCDIEKGRRIVSVRRAAELADKLGYHAGTFVQLAIQDMLDQEELPFSVTINAA